MKVTRLVVMSVLALAMGFVVPRGVDASDRNGYRGRPAHGNGGHSHGSYRGYGHGYSHGYRHGYSGSYRPYRSYSYGYARPYYYGGGYGSYEPYYDAPYAYAPAPNYVPYRRYCPPRVSLHLGLGW